LSAADRRRIPAASGGIESERDWYESSEFGIRNSQFGPLNSEFLSRDSGLPETRFFRNPESRIANPEFLTGGIAWA